MPKVSPKKPLLLLVLDGWGYSEDPKHNAIASAHTPNWDRLWQEFPHCLAEASGRAVGLPAGQMGNSEVGHLHMAAGREVPQDLVRIDDEILNGRFFENPVLKEVLSYAKQNQKTLHLLGLLSPGGVHSHEAHLLAMVRLAASMGLESVCLHAFLDGRDTPPRSVLPSIKKTEQAFSELGVGRIASVCGRYYAMDRDKRWDRTELAYNMLTLGEAPFHVETPEQALSEAYARGESDEFVQPACVGEPAKIQDGDVVIFMNFRADRARQLSYALTDPEFSGFARKAFPQIGRYVTLTEYAQNLRARVAYPPLVLENTLGEFLSKQGLTQLRIAETEKYAHVTFFFNGGNEAPYPLEHRLLVPSPKVSTYDLQPEMSAIALTDRLVEQILSGQYDFIVCNYANPDMVGHTGNFEAAVNAIEVIDQCLGRIVAALDQVNGVALITSDHGNAECMYDPETQQSHTAHTLNKVPVIYTAHNATFINDHPAILYDIAPTVLYLLGINPPLQMTGQVLLAFKG